MAETKKATEILEPKPKFPLWVVGLIVGQIVVVGVALMIYRGFSSKNETSEVPKTSKASTKEGQQKSEVQNLVGTQVSLDPFIVNLLDEGRVPRYLKIEIKFELDNADLGQEVQSRINQVRDELLMLLSSKRQSDIEMTEGKRLLRTEILNRMNKILITGKILKVYFTEFVIQ